GPGEEAGPRVDRQHERGLPAVLLRVERDDLVQSNRVVGTRLRVMERGSGEPHVGAHMRISLGAARMIETTQEAELFAERAERLGRFTKDEFAVLLGSWEPAPLIDAVLDSGQRHTVGGVQGTEPARDLVRHLRAHGVENGQGQSHSANALKKSPAVDEAG